MPRRRHPLSVPVLTFTCLLIALAACSQPTPCPPCEPVPVTVVHTREVDVPATVLVTVPVTEIVQVEVPVTTTPTPTPQHTPTPSLTPSITPTPTETPTPTITPTPTNTPIPTATPDLSLTATAEALGAMAAPKTDGFYLVGVDIAPGKWESTGSGDDCYWVRYDDEQNIQNNHYGLAGGTITIRPTDYEVSFEGCGRWVWVEGAERSLEGDAMEPKGDGFYTVGVEIAPGQWRSTGSGDDCYWARLDQNQGILDNHYGLAGGSVTIRVSDYEVRFEDCGTWEYLGP
ncbi:MAG: hypothetical protein JXC32_13720 [Anaerolineae bacterium]|nr:hypothetical protein [Anaerolineae bacterium]